MSYKMSGLTLALRALLFLKNISILLLTLIIISLSLIILSLAFRSFSYFKYPRAFLYIIFKHLSLISAYLAFQNL
jgi:hypothetical protein